MNSTNERRLLNLGCGTRYKPGWTNVDMRSNHSEVLEHDLRKPLPFAEGSFDFVYSSHVLEHFTSESGEALLRESVRVLKPGGIVRVVVPDLEILARLYLRSLERAEAGEENADADFDWSYLMLYDQTVRNQTGGKLVEYLLQDPIPNRDFILTQAGSEVESIMKRPAKTRHGLRKLFSRPNRQKLWRKIFGEAYEAQRIGRFRLSGEIHQWMYDRYSLARQLRRCGLIDIQKRAADESGLDGWIGHHLDVDEDGKVYKPESIFMEGTKA